MSSQSQGSRSILMLIDVDEDDGDAAFSFPSALRPSDSVESSPYATLCEHDLDTREAFCRNIIDK